MNGSICTHIRIFKSEIVYSNTIHEEFSYCIYCYSKKKKNKTITLIANFRDYHDEENNDILSFIEANNLTVKQFDYENYFNQEDDYDGVNIDRLIENREKVFIIDQEVFRFSDFFEIIEKRVLKIIWNSACSICGKKLNIHIDNTQCISCLASNYSEDEINSKIKSNENIKQNSQCKLFMRKINNPYHFVQKLKLNRKHTYNPITHEELVKYIPGKFSNFNISFRK
jgi:hypothetical protein